MATTVSAQASTAPEMLRRADRNVHPVLGKNYKRNEGADNGTETKKSPYESIDRFGILRDEAISQYILETSVYPREHKALEGIRKATQEKHAWSQMMTSGDEGQFLMFLLKLMNAKNTLEVGVFTGYSLLCTALALPEDGKEKNHDFFDFIFVDADKDNYINYHPLLLKLVRLGVVIAYDNTLWSGSVTDNDEESMPEIIRYYRKPVMELNKFLAADPRIDITQLSVSDGITLCRRLV